MSELTKQEIRKLKTRAQRLEPVVHLGKEGVTPALIGALNDALDQHELVKLRFTGCKEQKKEIAPQIAEATGSAFVTRVGHVAVYYRRNPNPMESPQP